MAILIKPEALTERVKIDKNMDIVQKTTSTPSSSNRIGTFGVDGRNDIGLIKFNANYFGATKTLQVTKKFSIDGISTTTTTTTTTTTIQEPIRYVINGSFAVKLFYPQMVMVDPNGDERIVDVEFENPSTDLIPSYGAYVVTTTFNPAGYKLKVSGRDSMIANRANYWAGEITLPNLINWKYNQSTNEYYISRTFTSSILTTTSTTTTTTAAPTTYKYTIQVNSTNADLSRLEVTVSNGQLPSRLVTGGKRLDGGWTFGWVQPTYVSSGWTFNFYGIGSVGRKEYTKTLTNMEFVGGICTINNLVLYMDAGFETNFPDVSIRPSSLDNPEDTNSLDDAINDYLNEQ